MKQIELTKLNKTYRTGGVLNRVLNDLDLSIEKGEFVSIIGKSGCGKTTLLNILGLLDDFDGGQYLYNGEDVKKLTDSQKALIRAEKIGFVNQDFMLLNNRTAYENVTLPLYFGKKSVKDMKDKAVKALSAVGCLDLIKKKVRHCSGGQKQRIAIARALITEPELILADEPTGSLDKQNSADIISHLKIINKESKVTVIIVTHDPDVAAECDRIIKLDNT